MSKTKRNLEDYIQPLIMNGLHGRMLRLSAPKKSRREILLIYGHHASIERMFGLADYINEFGAVTLPDLPGFGGMDPFYKIGEKPTLDNLADYLAAFIKLRYKNRRVTIVAMSFGFVVVTRMLQRYPKLSTKVDLLISLVGFTTKEDFGMRKRFFYLMRFSASPFSRRLPAAFLQHVILQPYFIRFGYWLGERIGIERKLQDADREEREKRLAFEVHLWQCNDIRTYMDTTVTMFTLNLHGKHVDLPVHHIYVNSDRYFNVPLVEQHMRRIYTDFTGYSAKLKAHAPTVVATAADAAPFIPPKIRQLLRKKP